MTKDNHNKDEGMQHEDQKMARALQTMPRSTLSQTASKRIEQQALKRLQKRQPAYKIFSGSLRSRLAFAVALVIALIITTTGTVAASAGSVPGEPLYGVKRMSEQTELFFTPDDKRPLLHASYSERRLNEIEKLAQQGVILPSLLNDLTNETNAALAGTQNLPAARKIEILSQLVVLTTNQEKVLGKIQSNLSPTNTAQDDLLRAQQSSAQNYQNAITNIQNANSDISNKNNSSINQGTATTRPATSTPIPTLTLQATATETRPTLTPTHSETRTPTAPPTATLALPTFVPTVQSTQPVITTPTVAHTPPGQEKTPPGQEKTPPGQEKTPPGQSGDPPGGGGPPGGDPPGGGGGGPPGGGGGKKP